MVINFRTVSIRGAFNFGRARELWYDGTIKVFDINGLVLAMGAEKPQKKAGFLRSWDVKTDTGNITMRGKCIGCAGRKWRRVTFAPDSELWSLSP